MPPDQTNERITVTIAEGPKKQKEVELTNKIMVLADCTHSLAGQHKDGDGTLKTREVRTIEDKSHFKAVMEEMEPKLNFQVDNRLGTKKGEKLDIALTFKDIGAFHPDNIAPQIPALMEVLAARKKLENFKTMLYRDHKLMEELNQILLTGKIDDLRAKLTGSAIALNNGTPSVDTNDNSKEK